MKVAQKLYIGVAAILALVAFLLALGFNTISLQQRKDAKVNNLLQCIEALKRAKMEHRLALLRFLMNGDTIEENAVMHSGIDGLIAGAEQRISVIEGSGDRPRQLLEDMRRYEADWMKGFAVPLMNARRAVDKGKITVAELEISFLMADPTRWDTKESNLNSELDKVLYESQNSQISNAHYMPLLTQMVAGFILLAIIAMVITFRVANSLPAQTEPWTMSSQTR